MEAASSSSGDFNDVGGEPKVKVRKMSEKKCTDLPAESDDSLSEDESLQSEYLHPFVRKSMLVTKKTEILKAYSEGNKSLVHKLLNNGSNKDDGKNHELSLHDLMALYVGAELSKMKRIAENKRLRERHKIILKELNLQKKLKPILDQLLQSRRELLDVCTEISKRKEGFCRMKRNYNVDMSSFAKKEAQYCKHKVVEFLTAYFHHTSMKDKAKKYSNELGIPFNEHGEFNGGTSAELFFGTICGFILELGSSTSTETLIEDLEEHLTSVSRQNTTNAQSFQKTHIVSNGSTHANSSGPSGSNTQEQVEVSSDGCSTNTDEGEYVEPYKGINEHSDHEGIEIVCHQQGTKHQSNVQSE